MKQLQFLCLALLTLFGLVLSQVAPNPAIRDCACYSINDASSASSAVFTEIDEVDFLHGTTYNKALDSTFQPQEYNVTFDNSHGGTYGKMALASNVKLNPLPSNRIWTGTPGGEAPGLQLWVRSNVTSLMVPMAEVASTRMDTLYGSFRIAMKMSSVPGTCGAFFWFRNDSQEIDMEFLSSQFFGTNNSGFVNLVTQTPASLQAGYDASHTPDFTKYPLPFNPSSGFHEYRFDWLPDRLSFYYDGIWQRDMTISLPNSPGHLIINHWSNGDPRWSGGPPAQDTYMAVSYVKAYFNSSEPTRGNCTHGGRICRIPDQTIAPDPMSGNSTGKTFFFSMDPLPGAPSGSAPATSGVDEEDEKTRWWVQVGVSALYCLTMVLAVVLGWFDAGGHL